MRDRTKLKNTLEFENTHLVTAKVFGGYLGTSLWKILLHFDQAGQSFTFRENICWCFVLGELTFNVDTDNLKVTLEIPPLNNSRWAGKGGAGGALVIIAIISSAFLFYLIFTFTSKTWRWPQPTQLWNGQFDCIPAILCVIFGHRFTHHLLDASRSIG